MLQLFSTVQLFFVCNYFYNYEGTLRGKGLTMYLTRLTVFKRREIWLEGCWVSFCIWPFPHHHNLAHCTHLQRCAMRWEGWREGGRRSLSLALPAPSHLSSPHLEERGYCVHWADGREWEGCAEGMGGQWEGNGREWEGCVLVQIFCL